MNIRPLKEIWQTFRETNPTVRIRDAAAQLGVSEAGIIGNRLRRNLHPTVAGLARHSQPIAHAGNRDGADSQRCNGA